MSKIFAGSQFKTRCSDWRLLALSKATTTPPGTIIKKRPASLWQKSLGTKDMKQATVSSIGTIAWTYRFDTYALQAPHFNLQP